MRVQALCWVAVSSIWGGCIDPQLDDEFGYDASVVEEFDEIAHVEAPILYCNRPYSELTVNPGQPLNAVGFLSNGCTAFLIDDSHVVAAAHCFVQGDTGAWLQNLFFYPNFHPDRVAADAHNVPRASISRVVVGSRVDGDLGIGRDWGIARVTNWQDTAGLDLTPIALATGVPAPGTPLISPAYTRHHFPYDDDDSVTWDNMEWDDTDCGWVGDHGGMWAIVDRPAPFINPTTRDQDWCNARWAAGSIHGDCEIDRVEDDVVYHNCDVIGGSSGSPVYYRRSGSNAAYVVGVTHGFAAPDFSLLEPQCMTSGENASPSVDRFRHAPRFASNAAVLRRRDNRAATAVYAIDSDLDQVVTRARNGSSPNYQSDFGFWTSLGTPGAGMQLSNIAACDQPNGKPQIFVVANYGAIWTRAVGTTGAWGPWSSVSLPSAITSVADLDASFDANGRCQLFMAANSGGALTRTMSSSTAWNAWTTVASGTFARITALNYDNVLWTAMIDSSGHIWRTSWSGSAWSARIQLARPAGIPRWADIDMTWDEAGRGFMVAIPTVQSDLLHFVPMYGTSPWGWRTFGTRLFAPASSTNQPAPRFSSITASRWMEDAPGVTSPFIVATGADGNVYFIEYQRAFSPNGWVLDWKSFYHEFIDY